MIEAIHGSQPKALVGSYCDCIDAWAGNTVFLLFIMLVPIKEVFFAVIFIQPAFVGSYPDITCTVFCQICYIVIAQ
jgi:hypothetical protein